MVDWTQDIGAYLKHDTRAYAPYFFMFPDWTTQDWEEVCCRIHDAVTESGLSFDGDIPRITVKDGAAVPSAGYHKRIVAETLLLGRYNGDGLLSLPHQKDPSKPRPS
jgi:hypothetical protein